MNWSSTTVFIGSRGIGKSFLSAVFCVIRCILYPGTKICIASGTRGQSINVLEKIMLELKPNSPELAAEIDEKETKINGTNAQIVFKNTSYIKVVTASDSARGNRANLLLLDEPCAALDIVCREEVLEYLRLYKERGGAVVIATHDERDLFLCDKTYVLKNGVLNPVEYTGDIAMLAKEL